MCNVTELGLPFNIADLLVYRMSYETMSILSTNY